MAVIVTWDNEEKSVVRYTFEAKWTWQDLFHAFDEANRLIRSQTHVVHTILDLPSEMSVPPGNVLSAVRRITTNVPPNQGKEIFVGPSAFAQRLISLTNRVYRDNYLVTSTLAEAREICKRESARSAQ